MAIGVVHLSDMEDKRIAKSLGLDILIGGHSHNYFNQCLEGCSKTGGVRYCKAGCYAQALGSITIEFENDGHRISDCWLIPVICDTGFDSKVKRQFAEEVEKLRDSNAFQPVASKEKPVSGVDRIRRSDVPIGRLVADMILSCARDWFEAPVNFAFINSGNIRKDLDGDSGNARKVDLHAIVPWNNEIMIIETTPDIVRMIISNFVACAAVEPQGFLQVAGIRCRICPNGTVSDIEMQWPEKNGEYRWRGIDDIEGEKLCLATIDFLVQETGGHHYGFLDREKVTATRLRLADAWISSLEKMHSARIQHPGTKKRIALDEAFYETRPSEILRTVDFETGGQLEWIKNHPDWEEVS